MKVSALGTPRQVARRYQYPTLPPITDTVIQYEDAQAEVTYSQLILWGSAAITFGVVCFNVVFLVFY